MNTQTLASTLATLFSELLDGPSPEAAYMLNRGDEGLIRSLDKLTAAQASTIAGGRSSIAAHVDHLRYGLSLMNRWAAGENPFDTADWASSWRNTVVSDVEWQARRDQLASEARRWLENLRLAREVSTAELNGMVSSIAHLAYHVGAIRQIDRAARGPLEQELVRSRSLDE